MVVLDTSALVRFFTQDIKSKARQVRELLDSERELVIPEAVFPELEYVLGGYYDQPRKVLVRGFEFLTKKVNVVTGKEIKKAVEIYKNTGLDMADCLIAARSIGGKLASFDKGLLRVKGVKKYWK